MRQINLDEARIIVGGGVSFSGAILNAIKGCISTIMDVGRAVGTAIRRIGSDNLCSF